ncbi:MAG: hypothetical protein BA863_18895 [Desulfovibrio sp. S3730MH75]|nr:MAG: hypothetical protein BA863_18895 [Desulfovibrio sp. S3730MH75]
MLGTNKQNGIAIGIINAVFAVDSLLSNSLVGLTLDFWFSILPGFVVAHWVYHSEDLKGDKKDN